MSAGAESSSFQQPEGSMQDLSPRQREKSKAVALDDVMLDEVTIDHVRPARRLIWARMVFNAILTAGIVAVDFSVPTHKAEHCVG